LRSLRPNEGKILQLEGKKVAAYRDADGKISLCSPVCTHLKCIVGWNDGEKTWDCPCHGSRFAATGEVLTGPAEQPLNQIALPNKCIVVLTEMRFSPSSDFLWSHVIVSLLE